MCSVRVLLQYLYYCIATIRCFRAVDDCRQCVDLFFSFMYNHVALFIPCCSLTSFVLLSSNKLFSEVKLWSSCVVTGEVKNEYLDSWYISIKNLEF